MEIQHYIESTPESLTKIVEGWAKKQSPSFDDLSAFVIQTHQTTQAGAIRAINQMATLRNWLIGCYIVEYEQGGSDRAKYGDRLLKRLEEKVNTKGLNLTLFKNSRRFYLLYPQIGVLLGKSPTPSDFLAAGQSNNGKSPTLSNFFVRNTISATLSQEFITNPKDLLSKLSFSHIIEIMTQDDPLARFFYETECIKNTWASSTPTCLIIRRMRCTMATTLPSVFCSAPAKAKRWWNTPSLEWTTNYLSLPICSNSQTRVRSKSSCWMK